MQGASALALDGPPTTNEDAFRSLVQEYSQRMFRLAFRMTGNEADAEDVVQETFLRAYDRMNEFESPSHLGAWLQRSASNYAIDLLRRRKRWRSSDLDTHETHSPLKSATPGQDREVFGGEVQQRIAEELEKLTPKERVAFMLRHHEGLSIKEISETMGSGVSATKNHIFRAVQKMRKALQPWAGDQ